MAQPIPLKLAPRDAKHELIARLEQAPAEHAAALLDGYELLQQMHEHDVFSLLRGALGATDKMVEAASSEASSTEAIRAMRNAVILAKMLGSIDPELLQGVSTAVGASLGDVKCVPAHPPGFFSLLTGFMGPDHRRGLAVVSTFLKNLGARWNPERRSGVIEK